MSCRTAHPLTLAAREGQLHDVGTTRTTKEAASAGLATGVVPASADAQTSLTARQFESVANELASGACRHTRAAVRVHQCVRTVGASSGLSTSTDAAGAAPRC
ncbi:PE domain-containing protein [Mycobacterium nebraskense]|nr:PE domain-containing protein [Mycobacterium nebraskense]MCV7115788.1 PE domain-containing protein [Mycobacterium nebraskense]